MSYTNKICVLDILEDTIADGPGFRTSIYSAGCQHECVGCHNPESWDLNNGKWIEIDEIMRIIHHHIFADVTFSGGDPFDQIQGFTQLAERIKRETAKSIWCYTGHTFEKIKRTPQFLPILSFLDVLVDGPFILKKKTQELPFRGSSNQRLIDVQLSLKNNRVVTLNR